MAHVVDLNGELVTIDTAHIPATDMGVLYGMGLFETLRAYQGKVFRFRQHLDRLLASAQSLHLPMSADILPDERRFAVLLKRNGLSEARIRLTVTGGSPNQKPEVRSNVLITAAPVQAYSDQYYQDGMAVLISSQLQVSSDPLMGHKTTCYWSRLQALHAAQSKGCGEALWFTERKQLAEGSISNIFIVKDQVVKTPPLDTPVLPGITRAVVIELCRQNDIGCEETMLAVDDLLDADEVFVTNVMMELVPVCRVERRKIKEAKVGELTAQLMTLYRKLVRQECGSQEDVPPET